MKVVICFLIGLFGTAPGFSQNPDADFSLPSSGCLGENIVAVNQSSGATRFEWDLCQGDLSLVPVASAAGSIAGSNIPTGVDVVFDGVEWYAFITNRNSHSVIRVSLGPSATGFGAVVDLGNISSALNLPTDIKIVSDNGQWYGFVYGEGTNKLISRLDFGASLTNAPTATTILNTTTSTSNQGLDVIYDGGTWYVVYTYNSAVGVLRLPTIASTPGAGDQMLTSDLTGNPSLGDILALRDGVEFYAYTLSFSSASLYRLEFGTDLFSTPGVTDISGALPAPPPTLSYYGLDGGNDAGEFQLFCSTLQGALVRIDLGADLAQAPDSGQVLGNLGIVFNTVKNKLVKHQSNWHNFSMDFVNGTLFRASFPTPVCSQTPGLNTNEDIQFAFSTDGPKFISLRSFNGGSWDEEHKSVTISPLQSPTIDVTAEQMCAQHPIQFSFTSNQESTSQSWDFGDGQSANTPAPQNTFAASGSYNVTLVVTASNGCSNNTSEALVVYDEPVASFALPTGLICTNNEFTFVNATTDNFDGNLTYQWLVNSIPVGVARDLSYAFTVPGNQDVKLVTAIPGCLDEVVQSLPGLPEGPTVGFSVAGNCAGEFVTFTNSSSGTVAGYFWDFGNGQSSTDINPTQLFPDHGTYAVSLRTTGTNGCVSTKVKELAIYVKPQPDFALDLPPFSCSGSLSQFHDLTPPPVDSNMETWSWSFGDSGNSSVQNPGHIYTNAGTYDVALVVTTDKGCSGTASRQVNIAQSPSVDFQNGASCAGQATHFSSVTSGPVASRLWEMDGTTFMTDEPDHTFQSPGSYLVTLTTTGANGCVASVSRTIVVPPIVTPDFSVQNACAGQLTIFTDNSIATVDPVVDREWMFPGNQLLTGPSAGYAFATTGIHAVGLALQTQAGCMYSLSRNISINPAPQAGFTMSPEFGPPPLEVNFSNTSVGANAYRWLFNDPAGATKTDASPAFVFTALGDYTVSLEATNVHGCADGFSRVINVVVPSTDLVLEDLSLADDLAGTTRTLLTVRNKSNYTLRSVHVMLDLGSEIQILEKVAVAISPAETASFVLSNQLVARNSNDFVCATLQVTDDEQPFDNKRCVSLNEGPILLHPFPNPAMDQIIFEVIATSGEEVIIKLFNSAGAVASESVAIAHEGLNTIMIDASRLSDGLYIAVMEVSGRSVTYRVSVQKAP